MSASCGTMLGGNLSDDGLLESLSCLDGAASAGGGGSLVLKAVELQLRIIECTSADWAPTLGVLRDKNSNPSVRSLDGVAAYRGE